MLRMINLLSSFLLLLLIPIAGNAAFPDHPGSPSAGSRQADRLSLGICQVSTELRENTT